MSMKREEEAGNARDTPPSRKRIGKNPGQACRWWLCPIHKDLPPQGKKSSHVPVVSLRIGSQPSNSTFQLNLASTSPLDLKF
jgi:hypothetical protein